MNNDQPKQDPYPGTPGSGSAYEAENRFASGQQSYPPSGYAGEGYNQSGPYATPGNEFAPGQQGYAPPGNGFAPGQQGYAPPGNGFAPGQQGYAPPGNGFAPGQQGYAPPAYMNGAYVQPDPGKSSAIASLVLGIVSVVLSLSIFGPICGVLGLVFANQGKRSITSSGMARTGRILSIVGLCISAVALIVVIGIIVVSALNHSAN